MKTQIALTTLGLLLACTPPASRSTVVAREMEFEPREIHASRGETMRLVLDNQGTVLHDLNVAGLAASEPGHADHGAAHSHDRDANVPTTAGVHLAAAPRETSGIQVKTLESGTYEFYCSLPGHREAGMKGKLIIH